MQQLGLAGMESSSAVLSADAMYRYQLTRIWDRALPPLVFVMLNPSTADYQNDDPTVRKCCGFAEMNGFGSIEVYNLFAYRSTEPKGLVRVQDRVGPENDSWIRGIPKETQVVAAWGMFPYRHQWYRRIEQVLDILSRPMYCVKKTGDRPWHPLYVKYGPLELL